MASLIDVEAPAEAGVGGELLKNNIIHRPSGNFAFIKDIYDEMPDYFDALSDAVSNSYEENGVMCDSAMEVMAEFFANHYSGIAHHISRILNDSTMYKVGIDKVEYTIDLPRRLFSGFGDYLRCKEGFYVYNYKLQPYKANKIKFLYCMEINYGVAKVVVHYQPFGRRKYKRNRFAKISLNFSNKNRRDLSRIISALKQWFGEAYYSALRDAVPTHVEMRVDFNGIHPCLLAFRGDSRSKPNPNYQPRYKRLLESVMVSPKSSKGKKLYFKSSQQAIKNKKMMGRLLVSRLEFVINQYKSVKKNCYGKRICYGVKDLDCIFFYENTHGFKLYDMNFLGDHELTDNDFQWLVHSLVNRGFHTTFKMSEPRIKKIIDKYILDTSKFMDDITRRFAKSLRKCKKLLCD